MRFVRLLRWDMRFQARYGFYLLYGFLTTFYTLILFALPEVWKENMAAILIFSDPAAMGLFFMGAIILLEKSQKVTSYFAITPLKARNYVWSKVLSLCTISLIVAAVLGIIAGHEHILLLLAGTFLASVIFTLCGIIVATKISSLNQFILFTVPIEIIGFIPAILHLFGIGSFFGENGASLAFLVTFMGRVYPANVCMDLVMGKAPSGLGLAVTVLTIVLLTRGANKSVFNLWQEQGGIKL
nr:ABC transporter permease [uncultured Butyrivibrio sp.]